MDFLLLMYFFCFIFCGRNCRFGLKIYISGQFVQFESFSELPTSSKSCYTCPLISSLLCWCYSVLCGRNFIALCGIFGQEDYMLRHEYPNMTQCVCIHFSVSMARRLASMLQCMRNSLAALRSNHLFGATHGGAARKRRD